MTLKLEWTNEQEALPISDGLIEKLEQLLKLAGEQEDINYGEVALSFVDDEAILALNKEYRGIDRPTDVLSFSMLETTPDEIEIVFGDEDEEDDEDGEAADDDDQEDADGDEEDEDDDYPEPLGDIVISIPRAIAQAEEYGHSVEREIGFLFVHGFLHLLGYDHEDEATERHMFAQQEKVLLKAGLTR
ncbi:rRNA maturation RNase YbeY [Paenibacillus koleovorans]|uniref:rRNA maturation RNase YbeY n=1 Tax=Paenibacillus koleovorans TaxID=121608 RepID=UPI000FDC70AB|nr:rRNA maturation RNase YbeY [Paenibacillus koleovorans]